MVLGSCKYVEIGGRHRYQRADPFAANAYVVGWVKQAVSTNYEKPYEIPPDRNIGQIER